MNKQYKTFDHVAGCSLGTTSDFDAAMQCIDFIAEVSTNIQYNEQFPDLALYYKELAVDADCETVDVEYYSDRVGEHCSHILPASTAFSWDDGELRITPYIDDCAESYTIGTLDYWQEQHDLDSINPLNPDQQDIVYEVNDHGNVNCYEWRPDGLNQLKWHLVWEMV